MRLGRDDMPNEQKQRQPNTDRQGQPFSIDVIEAVWNKSTKVEKLKAVRADACGTHILRDKYGDTSSLTGWEIDHIKPIAAGGTDDLSNLQPLYWLTNRKKSDTYPWNCSMLKGADGTKQV
jgi:hypothetical protein